MENIITSYNLDKGLVAWLDLSTYCNAGCPQCHRTNINGLDKMDWLPLIQWSIEDFKKAYPKSSLISHRRFEICGTWGDPMMNKDIFKIVEYIINNSRADIQINTNGGTRRSDFWWDLGIMAGERLEVWFDIDGINQEMHSLYRQKTNLDILQENVETYCSTRAKACAHVIVFKHNEDYLYEIEDMIRSWGIQGKILFELSNRFSKGPIFEFVDDKGITKQLEQATKINHPLINGTNPIRDHSWKKKRGIEHHELT